MQLDNNTIQIQSWTGIEQLRIENDELRIWPNPTNSILNVELGIQNEKAEVQVTDVLGNVLIQNSEIVNQKCTLDVSGLPAGVYFMRAGVGTHRNSSSSKPLI